MRGPRRRVERRGPAGVARTPRYPLRGDGLRADADEVVTNVVTDPYSLGLTTNSRALACWSTSTTGAQAGRLGPAAQAGARPARGLDDLRAARPRLLDQRRDRARPRTAAPTWPSPTRDSDGMRHLRAARRGRAEHACTCCRRSTSPRSRRTAPTQQTPACDLAVLPARLASSSRRASTAVADARRLQLGLRPAALHRRPRARYATDPDGAARIARVPRDGAGPQRRRPARRDGRRLQPHRRPPARTRSRCSTGSCPATTTGSTPTGDGRDLDLLRQHRDRARDDGEADGRLGGHLGDASTRSTASAST